eukprot:8627288-Karenia_brevis.AAC.1
MDILMYWGQNSKRIGKRCGSRRTQRIGISCTTGYNRLLNLNWENPWMITWWGRPSMCSKLQQQWASTYGHPQT